MPALTAVRALVTGGASGIGLAIAQEFVAEGAFVAVLDQAPEPPIGLDGMVYVCADVTADDQVRAAVEAAASRLGGLDLLVNNAGVGAQGTVVDSTDEEWHRVLDVNVVGTARVSRAAWPHLIASGRGAVVNICSIAATAGLAERAVYSASKGAVLSLTRAMAADGMAAGIRVNAVNPGTADTPWVQRLLAARCGSGRRAGRVGCAPATRAAGHRWRGGAGGGVPGLTGRGLDHRYRHRRRRRNGRPEAAPMSLSAPRRVDAHHHLWDLRRRPQPWTESLPRLQRSFAFEELEPDLLAAGIDATVLVHTVASFDETLEMLALAAARPRIAGVVGWFDLSSPQLAGQIEQARLAPGGRYLVGARHQLQVEPDPDWLTRSQVRQGLRTLAAYDLAYDVVVSAHQLPLVIDTVRALPEVRFILDHAGKPPIAQGDLSAWQLHMARLSRSANIAVKLSGLVTEADWTQWTVEQLRPVAAGVLDNFGAHRTMFGSDWPVCQLAASYAQVAAASQELVAHLGGDEQDAVWGGTARHWYHLDRA